MREDTLRYLEKTRNTRHGLATVDSKLRLRANSFVVLLVIFDLCPSFSSTTTMRRQDSSQPSGPSHVIITHQSRIIRRHHTQQDQHVQAPQTQPQLPTASAIRGDPRSTRRPRKLGHAMRLRQLCGCLRPATKSAPPEVGWE